MKDEIEFAGTASYGAGTPWTQRFGALARVEKVLMMPNDGVLAASGGSVRTLDISVATPDPNQVTLKVQEAPLNTDTAVTTAWTQPTTNTDLSSITFYGFAEGT